jgi:uncharacterized protein (DUF1330 family)
MTTENKKKDISIDRVIILVLLSFACFLFFYYIILSSSTPTQNSVPEKEVVKITAVELFNLYEKNEVAADEQFAGRYIEVTGSIDSIDKDFQDHIVIRLRTANKWIPASMYMNDYQKDTASQLKKGQKVIIRCNEMKRWVGSPMGEQCVFIEV